MQQRGEISGDVHIDK